MHKATGKVDYVFCNRAGEPVDTNNFTKRVWYPRLASNASIHFSRKRFMALRSEMYVSVPPRPPSTAY